MAVLSTSARNRLSGGDFALPGRKYPIPDRSHGANAKARVARFGTPSEKARVDAAVDKKFPGMGKGK